MASRDTGRRRQRVQEGGGRLWNGRPWEAFDVEGSG